MLSKKKQDTQSTKKENQVSVPLGQSWNATPAAKSFKEKVQEKLKALRYKNEDWYIGPYLVRGTDLKEKSEPDPYKGARMLSGWRHLQRFYELCLKPIVANLQKGYGKCIDPIWRIVYPCSFYVTITQSVEGIDGSHTLILWYSSSFRKHFPIAASTFDGHFRRGAPQCMTDRIKELRLSQEFIQSNETQHRQIPL